MKKWGFIIIVLFSMIAFSCKKEAQVLDTLVLTHDTLKPNNYLPVYPKSWWRYNVDGDTTVMSRVSMEYHLYFYRTSDNSSMSPLVMSDSVWVPLLDSNPIYKYDKIQHVIPPYGDYYCRWPILSETIGFVFRRDWSDTRYGDFSEYVEVKNKIFNGTDSVLILEGHWVYGPKISQKRFQEYTKGIGLTKDIVVDTVSQDTISKKNLIDYYIHN